MKALKIFFVVAAIAGAMVAGYFAENIVDFVKNIINPPHTVVSFKITAPKGIENAEAIVNGEKRLFFGDKLDITYENRNGIDLAYRFFIKGYESKSDGARHIAKGVVIEEIPVEFEKVQIPKTKIEFKIESTELVKNAKVNINGHNYVFQNNILKLETENPDGKNITCVFTAESYISQSDTTLYLAPGLSEKHYTVIFVSEPKEEEAAVAESVLEAVPKPWNVSIAINTIPSINNIEIQIGNTTIGKTDASGRYKFSKTFQPGENGDIALDFSHSEYELDPPSFKLKTTKNTTKTVTIKPRMKNDFEIEYTFLNQVNQQPIQDLEIKSSDGKWSGKSDSQGKIKITIPKPVLKQSLNFKIQNSNISGTIPDFTIDGSKKGQTQNVLCKVSYVTRIKIKDSFGNSISSADVYANRKAIGKTNTNGEKSIPIDVLNAAVNLKINKRKFVPLETSFTPIENNALFEYTLNGSIGSIVVRDSVTQKPIQFVDVLENSQHIGATDQYGKLTFPVSLSENVKLELKPAADMGYKKKNIVIVFMDNNQQHDIILVPLPYQFVITVVSETNAPISGATISYKNRNYKSDKYGKITIEDYQPDNPVKLRVNYGLAKADLRISREEGKLLYERRQVISSRLKVHFSSYGNSDEENKAKMKIYNHANVLMKEGTAPFTAELEPGFYKVKSEADGRTLEQNININQNDQKIEINMVDKLQIIKKFYQEKNYAKAIEIYEGHKDEINFQYPKDSKRSEFCSLNDIMGKCYSVEKKFEQAAEFMKSQIDDGCVFDDPVFYYNTARIFYELGKWEDASDYYNLSFINRELFPADKRAQLAADCRYFQANALLNNYEEYRSNPRQNLTLSDKCRILKQAELAVNEFVLLATDNFLNMRNAAEIKNRIYSAKVTEGCE
jgi:hypothetical protein